MGPAHYQESPLRIFEAQTPENIRAARLKQQLRIKSIPFPRSTVLDDPALQHSRPSTSGRLVSYGRATIGKHQDDSPPVPFTRPSRTAFGLKSRLSMGGTGAGASSSLSSTYDAQSIPAILPPGRASWQQEAWTAANSRSHRRTLSSAVDQSHRLPRPFSSELKLHSSSDERRSSECVKRAAHETEHNGMAKLNAVEAQYITNSIEGELRKRMLRFRALQSPKSAMNSTSGNTEPQKAGRGLVYRERVDGAEGSVEVGTHFALKVRCRNEMVESDLALDPTELLKLLDDLLIRCETSLMRQV